MPISHRRPLDRFSNGGDSSSARPEKEAACSAREDWGPLRLLFSTAPYLTLASGSVRPRLGFLPIPIEGLFANQGLDVLFVHEVLFVLGNRASHSCFTLRSSSGPSRSPSNLSRSGSISLSGTAIRRSSASSACESARRHTASAVDASQRDIAERWPQRLDIGWRVLFVRGVQAFWLRVHQPVTGLEKLSDVLQDIFPPERTTLRATRVAAQGRTWS